MKKYEVNEGKFLQTVVGMIYSLDNLEVSSRIAFLVELIRESDQGYVLLSEKKELLMQRLRLSPDNFEKLIQRLGIGGHVRKEGGIIYLHPKWRAVKECEGMFLISEKKNKISLEGKKTEESLGERK